MGISKDYVGPGINNREKWKRKNQPKKNLMLQNTSAHFQNNKSLCIKFKKQNLRGVSSWTWLKSRKLLWKVRSLKAFALHDCILTIWSPNWSSTLRVTGLFLCQGCPCCLISLSLFKLHDLLQLPKFSSTRARGFSLLSFWHYLGLIPRVQKNSYEQLGVRQERQLKPWAKIGWKEGKLL